ncbi:aBC transporter ATP-binding protein [Candidatus Colimorpha enterica]|uniref:ABC transporter ATP-binding protein n=1 Tax=Candidatus Colimorpha enterica TaxID=3083063 RepID=R6UST4_9BACT|nr:aBC transporter ATP-binding protein [Candidatus Colimorpha enterica]
MLEKGRIIFDGGVEEGIGVYMKQNDRLSLHYDYTGISRAAANSRKIELMGLDIPDGSNASPVRGEDLHFILHCRANENDSSVGVRFEISNSSGQIIGTSLSDRNISGKKGEMIDLDISMNTGNFSPGRYKAVAVLFESDENGSQAKIDRVEPALFFEVREAPGDINWLHTWWGDVRFNEMQIIDVRINR